MLALALLLGLRASAARAQSFSFAPPRPLNSDAATDTRIEREPDLAVGGTTWISVWTNESFTAAERDALVARSVDGGATWSLPIALDAEGATDARTVDWPHVATDGAGTWVVVWSGIDQAAGSSGTDAEIFVARSTDDGMSWTPAALLNSNFPSTRSDAQPTIATDGAGTWIVVWVTNDAVGTARAGNNNVALSRSTDGGATWSPATNLNTDAADDVRNEQFPFVATDGHGTWLTVWHADRLAGSITADLDIAIARSTDGGLTWSAPAALNTDGPTDLRHDQYPQLASDGNGAWIAVWSRGIDEAEAMTAHSADDGRTWSPPARLDASSVVGDGQSDGQARIATDGHGLWVAAWETFDQLGGLYGGQETIVLAHSTDAGATWTTPTVLANDVEDRVCGHQSDHVGRLVTDGAGTWVGAWYRWRNFCPTPPTRPDDDIWTTHTTIGCANGRVEPGEECDDGNVTGGDGCTDGCRLESCRPAPEPACRATGAGNGLLKVTSTTKRQLEWRWLRGTTATADFGDPTAAGHDYYLCIYDDGALVSSTRVVGGSACGARPCWEHTSTGYEFRETIRRPKSSVLLRLQAGVAGKAQTRFKARDAGARLPALPLTGPVAAQLKRADGRGCWGTTFSAPFLRNDGKGTIARSE